MNFDREDCLWEGNDWGIFADLEFLDSKGAEPCKHSRRVEGTSGLCTQQFTVVAETPYTKEYTGVCLECILEAAKSIGVLR